MGRYPTVAAAQRVAKKAAGRGARHGTAGVNAYYAGAAGTAWYR